MAGRDLTTGSIPGHLIGLTGPMAVGVLAVISVGLADAYFVGQVGEIELAAIGFIFPVTTTLTSLGIGLSAGANAMVSQALGRGAEDDARRYAAHGLVISLVLGTAVAVAGWLTIEPLFRLLNASDDVIPAIRDYMTVWYLGFPLLTGMLVINATIRAHGNTVVPSMLMVLNAFFNIGLDPVLIFGWGPLPAFGIRGAAIATLIAFVIAFAASLWPVLRTFRVASVRDFVAPGYGDSARRIGNIGAPASLANAINPAGLAIVTAIVAQFGTATVAGFGAAGRIESFAIVPLLSLSGSIGPVIGQNFGAGNSDRVARTLATGALFCVAYGLIVAVTLTVAAPSIAPWFSDRPPVQQQIVLFLRILPWSFFAYGLVIVINASLNARSKAVPSALLSLSRIALFYIPFTMLGAAWLDQVGLYTGAMAANIVAAIPAFYVARHFDLWRPGALANAARSLRRN